MSYMRGKYYLWSDSERLHLWAFDGEDHWKDSGWAESVKDWKPQRGQKPSGVCIPEEIMDEFAVMRFAELIDERKVLKTIRRGLKNGNFGAHSLKYHAKQLIARIGPLKADPKHVDLDETLKKAGKRRRVAMESKSGKHPPGKPA